MRLHGAIGDPGKKPLPLAVQLVRLCFVISGPTWSKCIRGSGSVEVKVRVATNSKGQWRLVLQQDQGTPQDASYKLALNGEYQWWVKHPPQEKRVKWLFSENGHDAYKRSFTGPPPVAQIISDLAVENNRWHWLRLQMNYLDTGLELKLKAWPDDGPEPEAWQSVVRDTGQMNSDPLKPTHIGFHGGAEPLWVDDLIISERE